LRRRVARIKGEDVLQANASVAHSLHDLAQPQPGLYFSSSSSVTRVSKRRASVVCPAERLQFHVAKAVE
jgi:hypothetical protein